MLAGLWLVLVSLALAADTTLFRPCNSSANCLGSGQICDREAVGAAVCRCRVDHVQLQGVCLPYRSLGQRCAVSYQCQIRDPLATCSAAARCVCRGLARPLRGRCILLGGSSDQHVRHGSGSRSPLRYPLWVVAVMMTPGVLLVCLAFILKRSCLRRPSGTRRSMSVWSLSAPRVAPLSAGHGGRGRDSLPPLRGPPPPRGASARLRELLPPPYTPPPSYDETVKSKPPPVQ